MQTGEEKSKRAGEEKSKRAGEEKSKRAGEEKSKRAGEEKSKRAGEEKSKHTSEEIYKQYADYVFKYLLSMTANRDVAEEVTQETFYQAIKSINKFDGSCRITTWLCAIAKNQLAVYRRKNPETQDLESIMSDEAPSENASLTVPSSEEEAIRKSEKVKLYAKLHACPEPYRELLYLRLFSELGFREIGEILGKTENWARVTFYRAKEMLKKEMEKDD